MNDSAVLNAATTVSFSGNSNSFIYFSSMADKITTQKRSEVMSKIRSKNTKPEHLVRRYLFGLGLRFRIHKKDLPGRPDIALPKFRTIIFINGCFWHGHVNCKYFNMPKTHKEYWVPKIKNNISKDIIAKRELRRLGWKVFTVWECQLKGNKMDKTLTALASKILNQSTAR